MIRRILAISALVAPAAAVALRCPGAECCDSRLTQADCATYTEVTVVKPMTPSYVPKKRVLVKGKKDETCAPLPQTKTISLSIGETRQEQESVQASGSNSVTLGATLKTGIKDVVGFDGSISGGQTVGQSYTFTGTYSQQITATESFDWNNSPPHKAYLNAFIFKREGSFSQSSYIEGGWANSNGCYITQCGQTTGSGYGLGWSEVVHWRSRVLPCACATGTTPPAEP